MQSLTLDQKIGQLFFIGITGTDVDTETAELLENVAPGGVCLFSRNIRQAAQTRKLLSDISEKLPVQPILSIDQEGGLVDRLRRVVTPMPSVHNLTAKAGVEEVKELAQITAEIVRILGFNMNFAPVVDVVDGEREKFSNGLQSRAFGKSVDEVINLAGVYLDELQRNGCPGSLKHFPGIGAAEVDSHDELPPVNIDNETLYNVDLKPYKELIKDRNVHAVMVGHAAYPLTGLQERDASGKLLPASLNHKITTKLLREELGFDKLVVTDDLEMGAILKNYGIGEACAMAIEAGNDMLLICASQTAIKDGYNFLREAVRTGRISETRINESVKRISEFKNLLSPPLSFDESRIAELSKSIEQLNAKLV